MTSFFNLYFIITCSSLAAQGGKPDQRQTLLIGGLFGIDTNRGGWNSAGIIPAVQMAIEDINNSTLTISWQFQCNIGESVRALVEYISTGDPKVMLLGPGCSKAAMPVAEAAHLVELLSSKDSSGNE